MSSKKKATRSLLKFLKNRKSVSIALGVCLAIAASAYVATAKFSASTTGTWEVDSTAKKPIFNLKFVDKKGKPVSEQLFVHNYVFSIAIPKEGMAFGIGSSYLNGEIKDDAFQVCKNGNQRKLCIGKNVIVNKASIFFTKDPNDVKGIDTKRYISGSTIKGANMKITLTDSMLGISSKGSSSKSTWAITDQKIKYTVKVVDQNGKAVSGATVNLLPTGDVNIKDNSKGEHPTLSMGTTDSNGSVSLDTFNICKKGNQKKACFKLPFQNNAVFTFTKLTPNAWKDSKQITKNTTSFSSSNIKDKTIVIRVKSATTSKAASAVKKVSSAASKVKNAVTGANKTAKVSTTPTKKDKATFSEALPPVKTGLTRNINIQFKDIKTKEPVAGPVKITVVYKVCSSNGCGGAVDGKFPETSFSVTTRANGMYALVLGVTNLPEVKKSGSKTTTTNRYFFFYGDPTHIVRHLYISDINGEKQKEVPIGGFPFATKTEAAAEKFPLKLFTFYLSGTETAETSQTTTVTSDQTTIGPVQTDGTKTETPSSSSSTYTDPYSSTKPDNSWLGVIASWFSF